LKSSQKMKTSRNLSCNLKQIRNICVVTGTRAEYGILRNLLLAIESHPKLQLHLIVTGMHLLKEFGQTINEIKHDVFKIADTVPMYKTAGDIREHLPDALARATQKIGEFLLNNNIHFIVVLGDRLEVLAGALAGLTANVPIVHLHGGELAPGDMDDRIRYAISALANIHCVATSEAKRRLIRTGQNPAQIFVTGALALDEIFRIKHSFDRQTNIDFRQRFNLPINKPMLIVLHHPAGFGAEIEYKYMKIIFRAVGKFHGLIIGSNNDPGHSGIRKATDEFLKSPENARRWRYCQSLPRTEYLQALYSADLLIGNSSSGIFEANVLRTAVVNIGPRQLGRQQNGNAIFNTDYKFKSIRSTVLTALDYTRYKQIRPSRKFGKASSKISNILANIKIDRSLLAKKLFPNITNKEYY